MQPEKLFICKFQEIVTISFYKYVPLEVIQFFETPFDHPQSQSLHLKKTFFVCLKLVPVLRLEN